MSNNTKEKTNLKLNDLPLDLTKNDIESFLSKYKDQINNISIEEIKSYKDTKKIAKIFFKDYKSANDCRINMNLRKIKNASIRIMWDEKDFQYKNYNKSNLYIKNIPKEKNSREIFEYFNKFGDIYSMKINEDEKGNNVGTGYITYYNQDDAKKAIDETNGKKIWDSGMELLYKNERNYHYNNDNSKININNLPDSFTNKDIEKLCEEFGKIQTHNIFNGQNGRYGVVVFSNEQEAKKAVEQLNNKEINGKKLIVKEFQRKPNYSQNNNYNNFNNYYNNQFPKYEEPYENANLYIKNIPFTVKEEDLKKIFEPFGTIKSIKLEKETIEKKENSETKLVTTNKGFGYISFENSENAKKALESLNNKYIPGFESWSRPLSIDFFIPKQKRQMMDNMPQFGMNYYGMQTGMIYPPYPAYPPQYPQMFRIPYPNQFNNMWHQGNYKNRGYNGGYKQKYNKRGGHRGGYYKNNHQRKNNNNQNQNNVNNNENSNNQNQNQNETEDNEEKKPFDYDTYNKLNSAEDKKDFLGEMLFNSIQENPYIVEKGFDIDVIGKITGMIIEIPNEKEIIEILEKPSSLNARILEALNLLNIKK